MPKTALLVSEIAGAVVLGVLTFGAADAILVPAISAQTASTLFAVSVSVGLSGVFGLLAPLLNSQNTDVAGVRQNAKDSAANRRVIYGYQEAAGVLTFDLVPTGNAPFQRLGHFEEWRHQVYTIAGHKVTSFGKSGKVSVNIDGIPTTLIPDPNGSGYLIPDTIYSQYAGEPFGTPSILGGSHIGFEFDLGDPTDSSMALPLLNQACPEQWTSNSRQRGCAKVHVAMRWDEKADGSLISGGHELDVTSPIYVSGKVPNFRFPVVGVPLLDTRMASGGLGGGGGTPHPVWTANTPFGFAQYIFDSLERVEVQSNGPAGSFVSAATIPFFPPSDHYASEVTLDGTCAWFNGGPVQAGGWPGPAQKIPFPYVFRDPNGNLQLLIGNSGPPQPAAPYAPLGIFTTGATEPIWSTTPGQYTADGGITVGGKNPWLCLGTPSGFASSGNPSNPALVIYDYLTNSDYGMGADVSSIDLDSVNAAANICEEQVVVYIASNGHTVTENRYSCDGVFDQSTPRGDVLKALASAMGGTVLAPGDQWHLFAGAYNPPSAVLTDDDLRDSIKADFRISRRDLCNGVRGRFTPAFLPSNQTQMQPAAWRQTDFPPYQGNGIGGKPNYIAEDGGAVIWKDVTLGFTSSIWGCQRLAKIILQTLRFQTTLTLACKLTAYQVRAGDTVTFIHARWNALTPPAPTTYFVTRSDLLMDMSSGAPAFVVDLLLRETDPSVYTFTAPSSPSNQGEYSAYGTLGTI